MDDQHEKQKLYMREYMKKRYNENADQVKNYNNSNKCKHRLNLPDEDFKTYGEYLADIVKLRKILLKVPKELYEKCLNENIKE